MRGDTWLFDTAELRAGERVLAKQTLTAVCPWDAALRVDGVQVMVTNYRMIVSGGEVDAVLPILMITEAATARDAAGTDGRSALRVVGKDLSVRKFCGEEGVVLDVMRALTLARSEWPAGSAPVLDAERTLTGVTGSSSMNDASLSGALSATPPAEGYRFSWVAERERWLAKGRHAAPDDAAYEEQWILDATVNAQFVTCPSYPEEVVIVNTEIHDAAAAAALTKGAAAFRTSSRFPIVTWVHATNGAAMVRSSQPKSGMMGSQSEADESLMRAIGTKRGRGTECDENEQLVIADARPLLNARANELKGGGFEQVERYHKAEIIFLNIGNIHAMRDARKSLADSLLSTAVNVLEVESMTAWSEASGNWFKHIEALLDGSVRIVGCIEAGTSVLVHCSDGWDRTSQLCATASLLLDGHYRTAKGFMDLVVKDWLESGHKFAHRLGLGPVPALKARDESPIFVQWIEAVWLLTTLYPTHFEFSQQYLRYILHHAYAGKFHNFLGNNVKDRRPAGSAHAQFETDRRCLWTDLLSRFAAEPDVFKNPCYLRSTQDAVLQPSIMPYHFRFWEAQNTRWMWPWLGEGTTCLDGMLCTERWKEALREKDREVEELRAKIARLEARSGRGSPFAASPRTLNALAKAALQKHEDAEELCGQILDSVVAAAVHEALDRARDRAAEAAFAASVDSPTHPRCTRASPCGDSDSPASPLAVWQKDGDRATCAVCNTKFTTLRRRHHCRRCGLLVCGKCSPGKEAMPGYSAPVRVCTPCAILKQKVRDAPPQAAFE